MGTRLRNGVQVSLEIGPSTTRLRGILSKVIISFVVPTIVLFGSFAVIIDYLAQRELEKALGDRLKTVASAAATHVRVPLISTLGPGMENSGPHSLCRQRLTAVADNTQVARIYVFDSQFRSLCDTNEDVAIHTVYHKLALDSHELQILFREGNAQSSLLFEGDNGKLYKSGYALVASTDDTNDTLFVVGVDAPATYFQQLFSFRTTLISYGAGIVGIVLVIAIVFATFVTRPIRNLAAAAATMGRGELRSPIHSQSRDEIGVLAQVMEGMRKNLYTRDEHMQMMLSGIAHEIRNPLAGITLFAGILRNELAAEDPKQEHVQKIEKELAYLQTVVDEFLHYAKPNPLEKVKVDLQKLVIDAVELSQADANALGVELQATPTPCEVSANPNTIKRVLLNLIKNALQASSESENARVRVSTRCTNKYVAIDVWNNGPAIPEDVQTKMFQPFFTTKEKGDRSGSCLRQTGSFGL